MYVPSSPSSDVDSDKQRLALVLATDPLNPTAEHAFLFATVMLQENKNKNNIITHFTDLQNVEQETWPASSFCESRAEDAWRGPILMVVIVSWRRPFTMILRRRKISMEYLVQPKENELDNPWMDESRVWSGVGHGAWNQFSIMSVVDCGDPNSSPPAPPAAGELNVTTAAMSINTP